MEFNEEIAKKCYEAENAEELLEIIKAEGGEATLEQATEAFEKLHEGGELTDDELDDVAGGVQWGKVFETSWKIIKILFNGSY